MSISDTLTQLSNRNVAMPKATIMVNGQPTEAELDADGQHVWINVRGRRLRVPRGKHSLAANLSTGTVTPIRPEVVAQPEPDEDLIMAQKVRRVREMAKNKPLPKDQRPSALLAARRATALQHDAATWSNAHASALATWRRMPLSERITEQEVESLIELIMAEVLADRELRRGYMEAAAMADALDEPAQEDEPTSPVVNEPVDPAPVAPLTEPTIEDLIKQIDAEVAHQQATANLAPVVVHPEPVVSASEPVADPAPRSVWTGELIIGMVTAPVKLFSRHSDRHGADVHMAHDRCGGGRLSQRYVCKACDHDTPVDPAEVGRLVDGVHVTADEFAGLDAEALKSIDVSEFVPVADLDLPVLAEVTYNLGAGRNGEKALTALREAMRVEGKAGVARVVLRRVERLVAVYVMGGELRLSVLRWADQIKPAAELPTVEVTETELDQARALVTAMSIKFEHASHTDGRQVKIAELLEVKAG